MGATATETYRALAVPRRLVPVLLLSALLIGAQWWFTPSATGVAVGVALCVAFWLVSPLAWRALFPKERPSRPALRLVVYVAVSGGVVVLLGGVLPALTGIGVTFLTEPMSLSVATGFSIVGGWGLGRDIDLEAGLLRARRRADDLAREAEQAQLLALRSHLDPHFLFNTLNAIAEWCREDGETAERATLALSSMLRTVMTGVKARSWPLSRELELVATLSSLHLIRDPELFEPVRDVPEPAPDIEVPPMILLPLVENAVKHGPAAGARGELRLSVREDGSAVAVTIDNPGRYRGPRDGGEGLPIVERRLALAYEGRASLDVRGEGDRTVATVRFPRDGAPRVNT